MVITAISCEFLQGGSKVKTTGIIILICNICYVGETVIMYLLSAACGTYIINLVVIIISEQNVIIFIY
jgi:hypothetical protein